MPGMAGFLTPEEWEALALSLRVALVAVIADLPLAFLAALLLAWGLGVAMTEMG